MGDKHSASSLLMMVSFLVSLKGLFSFRSKCILPVCLFYLCRGTAKLISFSERGSNRGLFPSLDTMLLPLECHGSHDISFVPLTFKNAHSPLPPWNSEQWFSKIWGTCQGG